MYTYIHISNHVSHNGHSALQTFSFRISNPPGDLNLMPMQPFQYSIKPCNHMPVKTSYCNSIEPFKLAVATWPYHLDPTPYGFVDTGHEPRGHMT